MPIGATTEVKMSAGPVHVATIAVSMAGSTRSTVTKVLAAVVAEGAEAKGGVSVTVTASDHTLTVNGSSAGPAVVREAAVVSVAVGSLGGGGSQEREAGSYCEESDELFHDEGSSFLICCRIEGGCLMRREVSQAIQQPANYFHHQCWQPHLDGLREKLQSIF